MITLEALEQLATDLELSETQRRDRLLRLIQAYARIVAVREPEKFKRRALEYSDEDGHYDNSFPPDQEYKNHNGPSRRAFIRSAIRRKVSAEPPCF